VHELIDVVCINDLSWVWNHFLRVVFDGFVATYGSCFFFSLVCLGMTFLFFVYVWVFGSIQYLTCSDIIFFSSLVCSIFWFDLIPQLLLDDFSFLPLCVWLFGSIQFLSFSKIILDFVFVFFSSLFVVYYYGVLNMFNAFLFTWSTLSFYSSRFSFPQLDQVWPFFASFWFVL